MTRLTRVVANGVRYLVEVHARPLCRSCDCVGLSQAAWYAPPLDWTVRDAVVIAALARARLYVPTARDKVWSADFMSDALSCGRRIRTFNIVDDFNREALHIEVDTSITSMRLVRIFQQLQRDHGLPQVLLTDNGPEFLGEIFVQWAKTRGMAIQYIQPGKPNQNAYIERFNRTFREEVLDPHLFVGIDDLREAAYWWMLQYNEQRPHDSLGGQTPSEFRQRAASRSTLELSA